MTEVRKHMKNFFKNTLFSLFSSYSHKFIKFLNLPHSESVYFRSAAEYKCLKRGVKEVVKSIRRGNKGLCVIAGNISPIDVITHLPILCEESEIPYVYVPSKEDLANAGATKRPTCCVLVLTKPTKGELGQEEQEKLKADHAQVVADVVELTSTLF